ncbi:MAG TPA: hypothetical protein VF240_15295 [Pyrinomonadaceae bacterium]
MNAASHSFHTRLPAPARVLLAALLCAACLSIAAHAQTVEPADSAPPKKYVPAAMKSQLAAVRNMKDRVKLTLTLLDERLQAASGYTSSENFSAAGNELGIYQALVDDVIHFLHLNGKDNNRTRDLFKRVELALRSHVTRLETIRRITPSEEAVHIRSCIEFVREARGRALDAFYDDDSVMRLPSPRQRKETNDGSAKSDAPPTEKKPDQN